MIVVKISDGLGNQMFQYALGRSMALKRGEVLKLDTSSFNKNYKLRDYLLKKFNIVSSQFTLLEKIICTKLYRYIDYMFSKIKVIYFIPIIYREKKIYEFDYDTLEATSCYFAGYWQDSRYFENIRSYLLQEFILRENLDSENKKILKNIKTTNSISIHVRRGDYLDIDGQNVCSARYYKKAIKFIRTCVGDPVFFIFSDDICWVEANLHIEGVVTYVGCNKANPEIDLELMKNCKHNIIANSTFGWWSAWLNNHKKKIVIEPREWKKGVLTPKGLAVEKWILL